MTVIHGKYEWDSDKNEINMRKHGIAFEEILPVFDDPYFYEIYDETHSTASEERYVGVGNVAGMMIVTTVFTERERIRIINARLATALEEELYNEYRKHNDG